MASRIDGLRAHIAELEREIEREVDRAREQWRYRLVAGRIRFDRDVRLAHARLKRSIPRFLRESSVLNALTTPIICSIVVPVALLDAWVTAYQFVCFPVYGIVRVRRSTYIVIDRHHLAYLNLIEKLNCMYCSYANGVFAYVREVGARTEQYWCPIRHATRVNAPHRHYHEFVEYGDAAGYHKRLPLLRDELRGDRAEDKHNATRRGDDGGAD